MVLWRPTRHFRKNTKKRCHFHYKGLECKSEKSRNTWNNRQTWPWSTEWSRAKANRVLPREHMGHSKHTLPTTQKNYKDTQETHGHHQMVNTEIRLIIFFQPKMEKLCTVSKNKTRNWLWLRSWTQFSSVQLLSHVQLSATAWIAAPQASLSINNSQSSLKFMFIESVMPSSHLILCSPLFLLPPIPASIRVFSNESTLCMRWPKYWSFSFSHQSFQRTLRTDLL